MIMPSHYVGQMHLHSSRDRWCSNRVYLEGVELSASLSNGEPDPSRGSLWRMGAGVSV